MIPDYATTTTTSIYDKRYWSYVPDNAYTIKIPDKKKVLVIGGRGLIGSAVCTHLRTNWQVFSYDIKDQVRPSLFDTYDAVIDCGRYDNQGNQRMLWNVLIDRMKPNGKLILFSSIYGHKAPDFGMYIGTEIPETPLEYAMSKAAVEMSTKYLAQKYKPKHIQVNCISPGGVLDRHSDTFQEEYLTSGGVGMIRTRNLFPIIDALLHEDNAINGQVITVDKGWSL